jgi:two-component system chemotaxis response regulator CheB
VLNEVGGGRLPRFRCQTGHAYGAESLAAAQAEALEEALAIAVRTHRDRLALFRRMEANAQKRGLPHAARRWCQAAEEAEQSAMMIVRAIEQLRTASVPPTPEAAK